MHLCRLHVLSMVTELSVTNTVLSFLTRVSKFLFRMSLQYGASDMEEIFTLYILPLSDYNNHACPHFNKSMMKKAKV